MNGGPLQIMQAH